MADSTLGTDGTATPGDGAQTAAVAQSGDDRTYTQAEVDEMMRSMHTQDEINRLIGEARVKVRSQFSDYEKYKAAFEARADYDEVVEARDRALADASALRESIERRDLLDRVSDATGVPRALLKGETEEELTASAEAVRAFAGASAATSAAYPQDKGGGASPRPVTREMIEKIKDPVERVRTRARHISLYD